MERVVRVIAMSLLLSLASVLVAGAAWAERRRLALAGTETRLDRSVAIALSAWEVEVVHAPEPAPATAMPAGAREARAIATKHAADAVAWLTVAGDERALWMYDVQTEQVASRAVAAAPNDDASAASVALTLKTLLRSSMVAPAQERVGAARDEAREPAAGRFRLEVDGAARLRSTRAAALDPRLGLALAWWPRPFKRHLGMVLRVEEGLGVAVSSDDFTGRWSDHAASLALRARAPMGAVLAFEASLGAAAHYTLLDGSARARATDQARVDPAGEGSIALSASIALGVEIALRAGGAYWGRWQRYLVDGATVLELSPVQGFVGLSVGAPLD